MTMNHWLVKSEPESYSWSTFLKDRRTAWTGVRNFLARNNLRAMKKGDLVCFYHSVVGKEVVGIARVAKESYPDPTAEEGDWAAVDLTPVKTLTRPVTLETIKADPAFKSMFLVTHSRLSVSAVTPVEFKRLMELAETGIWCVLDLFGHSMNDLRSRAPCRT
jgi:predicted RNA-binding protein with PUA-like domain